MIQILAKSFHRFNLLGIPTRQFRRRHHQAIVNRSNRIQDAARIIGVEQALSQHRREIRCCFARQSKTRPMLHVMASNAARFAVIRDKRPNFLFETSQKLNLVFFGKLQQRGRQFLRFHVLLRQGQGHRRGSPASRRHGNVLIAAMWKPTFEILLNGCCPRFDVPGPIVQLG